MRPYLGWFVSGVVCGILIQVVAGWAGTPGVAFIVGNTVMLLGTGIAIALLLGLNMGVPQASILAGRHDPPPLQSSSGAARVMLFCLPVFIIGFRAVA